jgi:pyruvate dehydrogenase E1 component alpha subunit
MCSRQSTGFRSDHRGGLSKKVVNRMVQLPRAFLLSMFVVMNRIRIFEERVAELILAGEIKTPCHLCIGQEGVAAGVCAALTAEDYVWGAHRSHGHYLAKGGDVRALMAELFGKVTGCSRGRGGSMHIVAPPVGILGTVPLVAATIPLAVGAGLASRLRGDGRVSVAFFGDGATEEGHFHESLNFAALHRLPVVFVCENNFYSSHMTLADRRPRDNIVEAAGLYGMPGSRVDGNDALEVYRAAVEAVDRARAGEGPSLLECRTYRWRGHVGPGWDLDVGVDRRQELREWMARDPIGRLRPHLVQAGVSEAEMEQVIADLHREVDDAVAYARESPYPGVDELLDHV